MSKPRLVKKRDTLLVGELEVMTLTDFRRGPGDVIAQVQMGKVFVLTKQGKPVAVISKPPGEQLSIVVDHQGRETYELA